MNRDEFLRWESQSRDSIDVKRCYIDIAGDLVSGILLSQIVYWHLNDKYGKTRLTIEREGHLWLAKKRADWWDECRISTKQFIRSIAVLEDKDLVDSRVWHFNGIPVKHIRIKWVELLAAFKDLDAMGVQSTVTKGNNGKVPKGTMENDEREECIYKETETTAKTTPEKNIECFATNSSPKEPDVSQTVDVANESRQHQDMNEVQDVKYISLDEVLDPNINPPSAAPLNNSQQEENSEVISGELVIITPVTPISDPYDLTHLGLEGMPEGIKKGLEEATKARDKKKYTYEIQNASKYLIGNLPKHYRKSKVILSPSPNDIDPRFKQYLFDQMKDAKEISEATNWIKAMELDSSRWEELSDSVHGFLVFLDTGKNMKQIKKDFKRQKAEEHSDGTLLDKIRKGLL